MSGRESPPGRMGDLVSQHRNSQRELATIERCSAGEFAGQPLLCIYDDATPGIAPMLLDAGTVGWLLDQLGALQAAGGAG